MQCFKEHKGIYLAVNNKDVHLKRLEGLFFLNLQETNISPIFLIPLALCLKIIMKKLWLG